MVGLFKFERYTNHLCRASCELPDLVIMIVRFDYGIADRISYCC
jgi:hypothetical protein